MKLMHLTLCFQRWLAAAGMHFLLFVLFWHEINKGNVTSSRNIQNFSFVQVISHTANIVASRRSIQTFCEILNISARDNLFITELIRQQYYFYNTVHLFIQLQHIVLNVHQRVYYRCAQYNLNRVFVLYCRITTSQCFRRPSLGQGPP